MHYHYLLCLFLSFSTKLYIVDMYIAHLSISWSASVDRCSFIANKSMLYYCTNYKPPECYMVCRSFNRLQAYGPQTAMGGVHWFILQIYIIERKSWTISNKKPVLICWSFSLKSNVYNQYQEYAHVCSSWQMSVFNGNKQVTQTSGNYWFSLKNV